MELVKVTKPKKSETSKKKKLQTIKHTA